MMKTKNLIYLILSAFLLNMLCTSSPTRTIEPTAKGKTRSGWRYFQKEEYERSLPLFQEAVEIDNVFLGAYSGLIWNYLMMDSLEKAIDYSVLAESIPNDSTELRLEQRAATLITYALADSFATVTEIFEKGASSEWDSFAFVYNENFTEKDVRWAASLSYFYQNDYENAAQQLQKIYPGWQYDSDDPNLYLEIITLLEIISNTGSPLAK